MGFIFRYVFILSSKRAIRLPLVRSGGDLPAFLFLYPVWKHFSHGARSRYYSGFIIPERTTNGNISKPFRKYN